MAAVASDRQVSWLSALASRRGAHRRATAPPLIRRLATRSATLGGVVALALAALGLPTGWQGPADPGLIQRLAEDGAAWLRTSAEARSQHGRGKSDVEPLDECRCRCSPPEESEAFLVGLLVGVVLWPLLDVLRLVQTAWRRHVLEVETRLEPQRPRRLRTPADT